MATKTCIFCGQSPTTAEHIIPVWAGEVLAQTKPPPSRPDKVVMGAHKRWSEGANPDEKQEWRTKEQPTFTAKCVCTDCNAGWMSEIEGDAKPILIPMIEDQPISLNASDQERVAIWLGLKAVCAQYCLPPTRPDREWANAYAVNKRPPTDWHIRIAQYTGNTAVFMGNKGLDMWLLHSLLLRTFRRPAFLFTVSIGHFVGQVLGVRQQTRMIPINREFFIQIWPRPLLRPNGPVIPLPHSELWPPKRGLDDSDLKKCSQDAAEPRD